MTGRRVRSGAVQAACSCLQASGIVFDALGLHGIDPGLGRSPSCCAVSYLSARPAASAIHPLQDLVSSYVTRSIGVAAYPLSLRNVDTHVHAQDTLAT